MLSRVFLTVVVIIMVARLSQGEANIGDDLMSFFNKTGMTSNVTMPEAHKDQSAGYYSGGGLSTRNRVKNAQIATLNLPSINAGCGGIDMFMGGFSHISKDALIAALRNIGTNAAGYAFKLGIKTIAPMIDGVMESLNDLATKINQANINSCETAATLLGGVWPKSDLTSRHLCTSMGSGMGELSDWAAARQGCGAGGKRDAIMAGKGTKEGYKDILAEEFNIAWEVIKRNAFLNANKDLAYLCMTLAGTIVAYKEGGAGRVVTYPSKADHDDLIKALFEGGQASLYSCQDTGKCLKISMANHTIPADKAFMLKVRKILGVITQKAINDEPLSQEEIGFIENVKLPIYKMINVLSAYKRAEFDLRDFTEIVTMDFIYQYITEILDVMLAETANLRNAQVSEEEISRFMKQLQKAKEAIATKRKNAYEQMNQALIMIETTRVYEKKVENAFDALEKGGRG
jgi:conjugative transfer pilus assembly protein TraH